MSEPGTDPVPRRGAALEFGDHRFPAGRGVVMGVINRTPDSFYPGAREQDVNHATKRAGRMVAEGADIIDVGGVRAGTGPEVSVEDEIDRVVPVIAALCDRYPDLVVSVDTWRAPVARAAAEAGACLINDTWQGADPELVKVAALKGCGIVCSHTGAATPRTDPLRPFYESVPGSSYPAVVDAVRTELGVAAQRARDEGVRPGSIVVDGTLDFGKNTLQSLELVRYTGALVDLGYPVMVAASRKDFVGESLDLPVGERLEGSLATVAVATWLGASVFRVHDVAATRRVVDMVARIRGDAPPLAPRRGLL